MALISKSEFKAHALEVLRDIEQSGKPRIITDRGKPTLEIRKLRASKTTPLETLKVTVVKYESPMGPIADEDWENN